MEAAIHLILANQQIPEFLWRHMVLHSGGAQMTSYNKHHGSLHVVLRVIQNG